MENSSPTPEQVSSFEQIGFRPHEDTAQPLGTFGAPPGPQGIEMPQGKDGFGPSRLPLVPPVVGRHPYFRKRQHSVTAFRRLRFWRLLSPHDQEERGPFQHARERRHSVEVFGKRYPVH